MSSAEDSFQIHFSRQGIRAIIFPRFSESCGLKVCPAEGAVNRHLRRYLRGERIQFRDTPVDFSTYSPFVRRVLMACRKIPYGRTLSYSEIARAIGSPRAARAVGRALGLNKVPIVVPCHRVLKKDQSLGGFGPGINWKRWLLALEGGSRLAGKWTLFKRSRFVDTPESGVL